MVSFRIQSRSITVDFAIVNGNASKFTVVCTTAEDELFKTTVDSTTNSQVIGNLVPYTNYNITVRTLASGASGDNLLDKSVERIYQEQTLEAGKGR